MHSNLLIKKSSPSFNSERIQKLMNLFAFLIALPFLDVFSNSAYFYIFLLICFHSYKKGYSIFGMSSFSKKLGYMFGFGVISTIFHPPLEAAEMTMSSSLLMVFRHFYWFAIGAFFYENFRWINWLLFAKWISIGLFVQCLLFYTVSIKYDSFLISITTGFQRNAFVFNIITFSGFFIFYLVNRYGKKYFLLASTFIVLILLFTNGRSGAVISLLLLLFNSLIFYRMMSKNIKVLLYVLLPFIVVIYINDDFGLIDRNAIGNSFETISPRFSELIKGEESGDLAEDKSWLIRELMLTKTLEIFSEYPLLGIGYDHFKAYDAKLASMLDDKFYRLRNDSKDYLNTRSSHNSYAEYLANTGIVGFAFLLSFIISIFISYFKGLSFNSGDLILIIIGGFIGAAIHGYAITAFTGANFWLLMGISAGFFKSNNSKNYAVKIP